MDLEKALEVRNRIAAYLNIDGVRRRAPAPPRVSLGLKFRPSGMIPALRARSYQELEETLGEGIREKIMDMALGEMDIEVTGEISAAPALDPPIAGPLAIGGSVGHYNSTAGSLGFFAQRLSDSAIGFVSNNHILADYDNGKEGDDILHPGPADRGNRNDHVVARLAGGYPFLRKDRPVVDAAFARLRDGDVEYDPSRIGPELLLRPMLVPLHSQCEVVKVGRSTGFTRGRINAIYLLNLDVGYPALHKTLFFDGQIEIVPDGTEPFSQPGDSGSLVVNTDGHPVGLLFSRNADGSRAYANPIGDVLSALNVRMIS